MRTVAILQARMGSSRLPGKVLLEIAGKPMIQHVVERAQRARTLDRVVIATTTDESDSPVVLLGETLGIPVTRGSLHDVLDRYYQAALLHHADVVVRITADCPLIDPAVIDETVRLVTGHSSFDIQQSDFGCNRLPPPFTRTFPIGLDVEVCTFAALERAWKESTEPFHREHVMPFLYEGTRLARRTPHLATGLSPRGFAVAQLHTDVDHGSLRWTVDTPEDLAFIRALFARLAGKPDFTWQDVLAVVEHEPKLAAINAGIRHKTMTEVDDRLEGLP